jgi:hypothetical protein
MMIGMKSALKVTQNFHTMSKMQLVKPQPLNGIWNIVNIG